MEATLLTGAGRREGGDLLSRASNAAMNNIGDLRNAVRQANKTFYDKAASIYEEVDGRRTRELTHWISQ